MLKIARGFGHKTSGKQRLKYRLDVWVEKVDNLPKPLKKCRVVWSRGPKLQMTDIKDVSNSVAVFKQKLSQIATIYKDPQEGFESKEYKFQLQVPGKDSSAKLITVGKGELDLSFFVAQEGVAQNKMVPIICKVGAATTAYLKLVITVEQVTGALDNEDGMTEVSGMTGMTATHLGEEQDLSGFDEPEEPLQPSKAPAQGQPAAPSSAKPRASRLSTALSAPFPAAAAAGREAAAAVVAAPAGNKAATGRSVPAAIEEEADGDVSPLNLSPSSSVSDPSREPGGRGAGKPSVINEKSKAAVAAGRKLTNAKADLFGSGAPTATSSRPRASKASELSEDEARAELFSSSSSRAQASAARPLKAPASSKAGSAPPAGAETGLPVAAAAVQRQGSSSSLTSSSSASTAAGRAGSAAAGTPVGGRRALLDRSTIRGATAAAVEPLAPSTSGRADASSTKQRGGSSSDTDDDDAAAAGGGQQTQAQQAQASTSGRTPGSSSSTSSSRIPTTLLTAASAGSAARRPAAAAAAAAAAAGGDGTVDVAAARLLSENEKLRAQLVALRDAAAASEEARRLARLAAETAAAERDDCRAQVQELQDQLKEAVVGMITAEEASKLAGQVRRLQLELQQQADQHLHQLQQQADRLAAAQAQQQQQQQQAQQLLAAADERLHLMQQQLSQQTHNADEQLQALQQQLDQANAQLQQQQEESQQSADGSGGHQSVAELQQQLAAMSQQVEESVVLATQAERQKKQLADQVDGLAQELESLRQQQRQQEAATATSSSKPASGDVPGISSLVLSLRSRVADAEQKACIAEKQWDNALARLVEEASAAGQQPVLSQQLASRQDLAAEVQESLTGLELGEGAQAMVCHMLLTLKAAAAAAGQGAESERRLASKMKVLTAALDDADRELHSLKSAGQHGAEPQLQCGEGAVVELQQQLDQLQQQNAQLQKQLALLPAKLLLPADDVAGQGHSPLIRAGLQGFGTSPVSSLGSSRDGDSGVSLALPPAGDDQMLQLQAALHAALADGQQCRRKLKAREKELELVQASDASSSGQSQRLLAVQQQLDSARSRTQQLLQDRHKLQAVLCDLETAAAQDKAELLGQLAAAHQELRQTVLQKEQAQRQLADALQELAQLQAQLQQIQQQLSSAQQEQQRLHQCLEAAEAAAMPAAPAAEQACQVIALADSAGPSGTQEALVASQEQVAELQRQLGEAEATRRSLTKECGRLKKQLADEQAERTTLEDQLAQHLEDTGDDLAQEAVAAYEAKYSRLKSRHRQLTESHHEEVDQLHQEIAALQERTLELEALTAQLEADRSQAKHSEVTLAETLQKTSKVSSELAALRQENQTLMQELVGAKLGLAQCSEREVIGRRELYKAKETNMKLASKMTKLETLVYNRK